MTEVESYLESLTPEEAEVIRSYYARAFELVPDAQPGRKYGMACLTYRGRGLVSVVRTKKGFSLFPFGSEPVDLVRDQLAGLSATKGGVQFAADRPVPDAAYVAMLRWTRDHIDAVLGPPRG